MDFCCDTILFWPSNLLTLLSIVSMIIVMLVVMVETTGDSIAVGEIVDKPIGQKELAAGTSCGWLIHYYWWYP